MEVINFNSKKKIGKWPRIPVFLSIALLPQCLYRHIAIQKPYSVFELLNAIWFLATIRAASSNSLSVGETRQELS